MTSPIANHPECVLHMNAAKRRTLVIALNPSTADAKIGDPSTRKLTGFTNRWGIGPHNDSGAWFSACGRYRHALWRPGYTLVNLFDLISTKPTGLLNAHAVGGVISTPTNNEALRHAVQDTDLVVVAWGGPHGGKKMQALIQERVGQVMAILDEFGVTPMCLGVTKDGHPRHPLMVPYAKALEPWRSP